MTASEFLREVDHIVELSLKGQGALQPCCSKGCSTCCSEALMSSRMEAKHILENYPTDKRDVLKERVKEWMERFRPFQHAETRDGLINGFTYLAGDIKCPLLEGNLCGVYEHRPLSCRTYFAQGNPEHCKMPHRIKQKIADYDFGHPLWSRLWLNMALAGDGLHMDHLGIHLYNLLFEADETSSVTVKYYPQ